MRGCGTYLLTYLLTYYIPLLRTYLHAYLLRFNMAACVRENPREISPLRRRAAVGGGPRTFRRPTGNRDIPYIMPPKKTIEKKPAAAKKAAAAPKKAASGGEALVKIEACKS